MIILGKENDDMLNEIREFEQYSYNCVNNHEQGRLKHKALISNSFSGIGRAMTTVARYYMFLEDKNMKHLSSIAEQEALTAIKLWCGANVVEKTAAESIRDWLPNYIRYVLLSKQVERFKNESNNSKCDLSEERDIVNRITERTSGEELIELSEQLQERYEGTSDLQRISAYKNWIFPITHCIERVEEMSKLRKRFGHHMFQFEFQKSDSNDIKAITYERILAEAFHKGSLKRYYLCCDDKSILADYSPKKYDITLKTIASYLLNKNDELMEQSWVFINKTDIINWLKDINKADNYKLDSSVFQTQKLGGNMIKLCVEKYFVKHFVIIEESLFNEEDWNNGFFFRDDGSQSYLVKNELYQ